MDVYCFGQLLFEMTFGSQLNGATCDQFPFECPAELRKCFDLLVIRTLVATCGLSNVKSRNSLKWGGEYPDTPALNLVQLVLPLVNLCKLPSYASVISILCIFSTGSVMESILTTEACKNGIPTLNDLLIHP